jgi:hypothetical protein
MSVIVAMLVFIFGLIALYYLYTLLFANPIPVVNVLAAAQSGSIVGPTAGSLPPLYQGGQFTISTWVYINNFAYSNGYNAPIVILGGANFDTLRVYLGSNGQLCVRVGITASTPTLPANDNIFTQPITNSTVVPCDIPHMDLQRWVNLVVALNGKLCDVYLDGKLVRSCSLDNYFNVDTTPTLKICPAPRPSVPGFGGIISTTNVYGLALSPDVVYKNYMAGPSPVTNFFDYLMSFFSPSLQ